MESEKRPSSPYSRQSRVRTLLGIPGVRVASKSIQISALPAINPAAMGPNAPGYDPAWSPAAQTESVESAPEPVTAEFIPSPSPPPTPLSHTPPPPKPNATPVAEPTPDQFTRPQAPKMIRPKQKGERQRPLPPPPPTPEPAAAPTDSPIEKPKPVQHLHPHPAPAAHEEPKAIKPQAPVEEPAATSEPPTTFPETGRFQETSPAAPTTMNEKPDLKALFSQENEVVRPSTSPPPLTPAPVEEAKPPVEINLTVPGVSEQKRTFPALAADVQATLPTREGQKEPERESKRPYAHQPPKEPLSRPLSAQPKTNRSIESGQTAAPEPQATPHPQNPAATAVSIPRTPATNMTRAVNNGRNAQTAPLQKRITQLEATVAAQAAKLEQADKQPPAPVAPVTIVNQPAQPAGPPRAYWARSYLTRFRLR